MYKALNHVCVKILEAEYIYHFYYSSLFFKKKKLQEYLTSHLAIQSKGPFFISGASFTILLAGHWKLNQKIKK